MINTVVLAGRFLTLNKDVMTMDITVTNKDDTYNISVPVLLSGTLLKHVKEMITSGDLIGIKGFIDNKNNTFICVAEKITFLSNKK